MDVDLNRIENGCRLASLTKTLNSGAAKMVLDEHLKTIFRCRICRDTGYAEICSSSGLMGSGGGRWINCYTCNNCSIVFMDPWKWSGTEQKSEKLLLIVPLIKLALAKEWITQDEAKAYPLLTFESLVWVLAEACQAKVDDPDLIMNVSRMLHSLG